MAINQVTAARAAAMRQKSAYALPLHPSEAGWKPDEIRKTLWQPLLDGEDSLLSELNRVAAEADEAVRAIGTEENPVAHASLAARALTVAEAERAAVATVAENLTGRVDQKAAEFLFRPTAGRQDIGTKEAVLHGVFGNTIDWNQLMPNGDFSAETPTEGWTTGTGTLTVADGVATLTNETASAAMTRMLTLLRPVEGNRRCALIFDVTAAEGVSELSVCFVGTPDYGHTKIPATVGRHTVFLPLTQYEGIGQIGLSVSVSAADDGTYPADAAVSFTHVQFFDLSGIYGSGREPDDIGGFIADYGATYYPSCVGELRNVKVSAFRATGRNLYDAANYLRGDYHYDTGLFEDGYNRYCTKNAIPVLSESAYCVDPVLYVDRYFFYDGSGALLSVVKSDGSATITTPPGARRMHINFGTAYHKGDPFRVQLVWSGYLNDEPATYRASELSLSLTAAFPDGMNGTATVSDVYRPGEVARRCIVSAVPNDAFRSQWVSVPSGYTSYIANIPTTMPQAAGISGKSAELVNDRGLENTTNNSLHARHCYLSYSSSSNVARIMVVLKKGETPASYFGTRPLTVCFAMPYSVPVDGAALPAAEWPFIADDFGTEEFIATGEAVPPSAPVRASVSYAINAPDALRRLPCEYVSCATLNTLTDALAAALGLTITRQYDDRRMRYVYRAEKNAT